MMPYGHTVSGINLHVHVITVLVLRSQNPVGLERSFNQWHFQLRTVRWMQLMSRWKRKTDGLWVRTVVCFANSQVWIARGWSCFKSSFRALAFGGLGSTLNDSCSHFRPICWYFQRQILKSFRWTNVERLLSFLTWPVVPVKNCFKDTSNSPDLSGYLS